jgi:hypothetical protein
MAEAERRAFLEICDERYLTRSTLLTSQLPVSKWHAQIGDPTVADSILDRLVHAAHKLELKASRCGRSGAGGTRMRSRRRVEVFLGNNSSRPTGSFRQRPKTRDAGEAALPALERKTTAKPIDGCRSLFHTERALRRFAPF